MADAKTREKEDELVLARAEFDRKVKLLEERLIYRRENAEDRKIMELKHEHQIEIQDQKNKADELQEQIEYLNERCNKLLVENKEIRLKKDTKGEIKRLEEENALLKDQATRTRSASFAGGSKDAGGAPQTDDSAIIEGMSRENEKAERKIRELKEVVKSLDKALTEEKKRSHEMQLTMMKDKNKVFVETAEEDVDIHTANVMGSSNAISEKQLKDLHENL
jgi:hypothetical protein